MTWHAYEVAVKTMQHMYKGELWVRGRSLGKDQGLPILHHGAA